MITVKLLLILGIVSTSSPIGLAMRFDIQSGATKCITEEIRSNSMSVGNYAVVNPNDGFPLPDSHRITVRVTSPRGNNYHYADQKDSGTFAFTAAENGDYLACFWAAEQKPPSMLSVDFVWKSGVSAKDWTKIAKRGQLEGMELELKRMFDMVTSIHDEMFYLREREEDMQKLNRTTNSRMATFTFFSIVVCLSVAALQLWHLKVFFERKKLL